MNNDASLPDKFFRLWRDPWSRPSGTW